jgi:GNAT superfamily N-acetyltransferase
MSDIVIREIDVGDEAELRRWWETGRAAAADRLFDHYPPWEVSREALPKQRPDSTLSLVAAYDGDEMVGIAAMTAPLSDNLHLIEAEVDVPVDRRRRRVGRRLLAEVEAWATGLGRTTILGQTFVPPGGHSPGERFALAHGFAVGHREGFKVLDLTEHRGGWPDLEAQVAERIGDYRIVQWQDHAPDELVDDLCAALSRFMSMIPLGDLELEDMQFTPERLRANEQREIEIGYRNFGAAALDATGALVGYSDLRVARVDPRQASIGITMVLPEHRGHRLGLATKLATHRTLLREVPDAELVRTGNADVNQHMNAVNELMGYRLVEEILELQKRL